METKICSKCKKELPIENFRWKNKAKNLKHSQCKQCQSQQEKQHYLERKEKIIQRDTQYKQRNNLYILSRKECGCAKCGEKRPQVLDFHHIDASEKNNTINNLRTCSLEKLKEEIDKCVVLCANCHRYFHYLEFEYGITLDEYLDS